jgi:hypothetical protein
MSTPRTIKVFIASPGDLAVERRAFKDVVDELNKGYGRGAHVTFEALGCNCRRNSSQILERCRLRSAALGVSHPVPRRGLLYRALELVAAFLPLAGFSGRSHFWLLAPCLEDAAPNSAEC